MCRVHAKVKIQVCAAMKWFGCLGRTSYVDSQCKDLSALLLNSMFFHLLLWRWWRRLASLLSTSRAERSIHWLSTCGAETNGSLLLRLVLRLLLHLHLLLHWHLLLLRRVCCEATHHLTHVHQALLGVGHGTHRSVENLPKRSHTLQTPGLPACTLHTVQSHQN